MDIGIIDSNNNGIKISFNNSADATQAFITKLRYLLKNQKNTDLFDKLSGYDISDLIGLNMDEKTIRDINLIFIQLSNQMSGTQIGERTVSDIALLSLEQNADRLAAKINITFTDNSAAGAIVSLK